MPTQRELAALMNGFMKRQGWTSQLFEDSSYLIIQLQHNDYWLMGDVIILEDGYQVQFDIQELDENGEVVLDYLNIVEVATTINQLRVVLQKIIDDWRDVHKPIFNALLKLLELRKMACGENPPAQVRMAAEKALEGLGTYKGLEYIGHD